MLALLDIGSKSVERHFKGREEEEFVADFFMAGRCPITFASSAQG